MSKKVILIILDGFGVSPVTEGNAVYQAKTPFFTSLVENYPTCLLSASGAEVGLDWGEMGNSEVGHFNLGTGRVVLQDFTRINRAIENKSFFENENLIQAVDYAKRHNSILHLVGLLSTGGVHAHIDHVRFLLSFCYGQKVKNLALHLFADGRDTAPKIAGHLLDLVQAQINSLKMQENWKIASLVGRFYAMDRDNHWERTTLAYDLLTQGKGEKFKTYQEALIAHYQAGNYDEELKPIILVNKYTISDHDAVIFFNFRRDRSKQIAQCIIDPKFDGFKRAVFFKDVLFVGFTNLGLEPSPLVKIAFFTEKISDQLAYILAKEKINHLHIAETEKYAHVTYFFNGGAEKPYEFETRILIPSPRVDSYAKAPEMSAAKITDKFLNYYAKNQPGFTVMNFANPDMVGHTGDLKATIHAIETVDICLKRILTSKDINGAKIIITADHGNAEQLINPETHEIDKEHTTNPVPFIIIEDLAKLDGINYSQDNKKSKMALSSMQPIGVLADATTTALDLLEINKSEVMTGTSLRGNI